MRRKGFGTNNANILLIGLLIVGWITAYVVMPSDFDGDGPFYTEAFEFNSEGLPFISKVDLKFLGMTVFVLETRENMGPAPGTVFVLKSRSGKIRWTRLGPADIGRIRLEDHSARWFLPGGWVIQIKPEYTGFGELFVSPFGNFRFFYHRW
jgi:hypothetical protein